MLEFFLFTPFILQAIAMIFDELYFHKKRGLGLWEKIGHPLDTLTVIVCFIFIITNTYSENTLYIFMGLAFFSSVFVTKDEFVHTELCEARENWLHAFLFILHPMCFISAAYLWKNNLYFDFIKVQVAVLAVVMFYQIFYWSLSWKKQQ